MRYIVSRFNHDISWFADYTDDFILYDRSPEPVPWAIIVPNIGSDIYDKFTYIVENYNNLPDVAVYTKANLFKYISKEEFDTLKDNTEFTPLLTQNHITYLPICYYENGMYFEINNYWYLGDHPTKNQQSFEELKSLLGMDTREYNQFAPGANYILPRENILKHPKEFYQKLLTYLDWTIYPGEAYMIERSLYHLWH